MKPEMQRHIVNTPTELLERIDKVTKSNMVRYCTRTQFINTAILELLIKEEKEVK